MQVVEHDTNMYPYGMFMTGAGAHLAYVPELKPLYDGPLPVEVVQIVADTMNADLRAGWGREHIEGLVERRVQTALELL